MQNLTFRGPQVGFGALGYYLAEVYARPELQWEYQDFSVEGKENLLAEVLSTQYETAGGATLDVEITFRTKDAVFGKGRECAGHSVSIREKGSDKLLVNLLLDERGDKAMIEILYKLRSRWLDSAE